MPIAPYKQQQAKGGTAPVVQQSQQPVTTAAPQPYPNTWSLQGGFDLSGPGAAEDAYARYGSQLAAPGAAEQFAQQPGSYDAAVNGTKSSQFFNQYNPMNQPSYMQQYATDPSGYGNAVNSTASGQYWNSLQGNSNVPKDMSAYYNRASERQASDLNRQYGARGMYNSSAALDRIGQAETDLRAQQAKDEAAYGLQSADLNNRIMSGAAQAADTSGMSRYGQGLQAAQGVDTMGINRFNAGLSGAGQVDTSGLSRYGAGLQTAQAFDAGRAQRLGLLGSGASSADASRLGRVGGVYDNLAGLTGNLASTAGSGFDSLIGTDQGLFDMSQQMSLGAGLANLGGVKDATSMNLLAAQGAGQAVQGAGQDAKSVAGFLI